MTSRTWGTVFVSSLALGACSGGATSGTGGAGGSSVDATVGKGATAATGANATGSGTASTGASSGSGQGGAGASIHTVFLIMMENHSFSDIKGNSSAPYLNSLLSTAAHAEDYKSPPGNHPSEPNYIWLEAGSNLGITTDDDPSSNHVGTADHLTSRLDAAGISWTAYAEDISGTDCPQADTGLFAVRHTPQLFFDDVTDNGLTTSAHCIQHVRPYSELQSALAANAVSRFNFITPDLCHDMHGQPFGITCFALTADLVHEGDTWLSTEIPKITASAAYQNGGAIFIVWDEGTEPLGQTASDGPLPFFVLSPLAKPGYAGTIPYTHSSTLRTLQEIYGLTPLIRDAANATDLSDLFTTFP